MTYKYVEGEKIWKTHEITDDNMVVTIRQDDGSILGPFLIETKSSVHSSDHYNNFCPTVPDNEIKKYSLMIRLMVG